MYRLIQVEPNNREFILHTGSYNECCSVFEEMTGIEFYDGIALGLVMYFIDPINKED